MNELECERPRIPSSHFSYIHDIINTRNKNVALHDVKNLYIVVAYSRCKHDNISLNKSFIRLFIPSIVHQDLLHIY